MYVGLDDRPAMRAARRWPLNRAAGRVPANRRAQAVLLAQDEAEAFLEVWTLALDGPTGPANVRIILSIEGDRVVARVSSDLMSDGTVREFSRTGNAIVLRYTSELWGYSVPVVVTLLPLGSSLQAHISIMRQFELSGVATKEHQPDAQRQRGY